MQEKLFYKISSNFQHVYMLNFKKLGQLSKIELSIIQTVSSPSLQFEL